MGKKNKSAAVDTENVAPAEQMEFEDAPPAKKKSKAKLSAAEIDTPAPELNGTKKDKKKKNKELSLSAANNAAESETVKTMDDNQAEEKKPKKKKKGVEETAEEGAKNIASDNHAEDANGTVEEKKSKKKKKNQKSNDATGEDEQLISFKKPSKKRTAEQDTVDNETEVPSKVAKTDRNGITAGTTIDQVTGIKLKKKKGKREKRRENYAAQIDQKKEKSKLRVRDEMQQYLECWSKTRDKWKFHKQTQIHIQKHVFDEVQINADLWPIALEYLSGSKGSCKEMLVKRAKSIINDGDAKAAAADGDETLQASSKYERARELLQFLG